MCALCIRQGSGCIWSMIKDYQTYVDGNVLLWLYQQRKDESNIINAGKSEIGLCFTSPLSYSHYSEMIGSKENAYLGALLAMVEEDEKETVLSTPDWWENPEVRMRFKRKEDGTYIVAQVAFERYALIGLSSGNRYEDPIGELSSEIFGSSTHTDWELVETVKGCE